MAVRGLIIFVALLSSFVVACYGEGLFSELKQTLKVTSSPTGKVFLIAGKDEITVTWGLNSTSTKTTNYKNVEVKLCYLEESQKDRPWRKTEDDLKRDKTCQFLVAEKEFTTKDDTVTYKVKKDVPSAHYFIRAYVSDGPKGKLIAYGQTTGLDLQVKGISGRSLAIDVAASVFSGFSVLSLVYFYFMEKSKAKRAS